MGIFLTYATGTTQDVKNSSAVVVNRYRPDVRLADEVGAQSELCSACTYTGNSELAPAVRSVAVNVSSALDRSKNIKLWHTRQQELILTGIGQFAWRREISFFAKFYRVEECGSVLPKSSYGHASSGSRCPGQVQSR